MAAVIALTTLVGLASDEASPEWALPSSDSRAFAYTTPDRFVVIRDGVEVTTSFGVFRQEDPIVWTNSGDFVAFLSNPPRTRSDDRELVFIDAKAGTERRLPCTGCTDLAPFERNSIAATRSAPGLQRGFLRFDLQASTPGVEMHLGDPAGTRLDTGSNFRLLATEHEPGTEEPGLVLVSTPTYAKSWVGSYPNGHAFPSTAAPSADRMAEMFLSGGAGAATTSERGCDTHLWLSLISGDGSVRKTDLSAAGPPGFLTDGHGELWLDDAWWGIDGRFHATLTARACTEGAREVNERQTDGRFSRMHVLEPISFYNPTLWTLDNATLRWLPEPGAPRARMTRYLGHRQAIQLRAPSCLADPRACRQGKLYFRNRTTDYLVATDVMTISVQPLAMASPSNSCPVEVPRVGVANIVVRHGTITCERATEIYNEYQRGDLPRTGNAQHSETTEWHCSSPTAGRRTSTGIIVSCEGPPAKPDWTFEITDIACGTDLWSPLIDAAITSLPTESITHTPWSRDPRTFQGNYDPCKSLSAIVISIEGATGSSPDQVLLFHKGVFVGTPTIQAHGFISLNADRTTDDSLALTYKLPGSCNACADASYFPVEIHWNGDTFEIIGSIPN